jgi:hypothetical protein
MPRPFAWVEPSFEGIEAAPLERDQISQGEPKLKLPEIRPPASWRVTYAASTCSNPTNGDSSSSSNGTRSTTR